MKNLCFFLYILVFMSISAFSSAANSFEINNYPKSSQTIDPFNQQSFSINLFNNEIEQQSKSLQNSIDSANKRFNKMLEQQQKSLDLPKQK